MILERLDYYDWKEAFKYAAEPTKITETAIADGIDAGFTREDVQTILHIDDGENDGKSWIAVFRLKDGRFAFLEASCDYTGWGCQEGGHSFTAPSYERLLMFGLGKNDRERFMEAVAA